jgi:hypothetical protein
LLVSAVIADARNLLIPAVAKISAAALQARAVVAAVPADTDALAFLPLGNASAQFIDNARHFMPWNTGILNSGQIAFFREHITVANTTGLHLDENLSRTGFGNLALHNLEITARFGNLRRFHGCHRNSCRCHRSSLESLATTEKR